MEAGAGAGAGDGEGEGRVGGEVVPVSIIHSSTYQDNEENVAAHSNDLDLDTTSWTDPASSHSRAWLLFQFDKVHCVEQITWYDRFGAAEWSWSCSQSGCSACVQGNPHGCSAYTVRVGIDRDTTDMSFTDSNCKRGDTLKISRNKDGYMIIREISITAKTGKLWPGASFCTLHSIRA